jgi:hypothetical protein
MDEQFFNSLKDPLDFYAGKLKEVEPAKWVDSDVKGSCQRKLTDF